MNSINQIGGVKAGIKLEIDKTSPDPEFHGRTIMRIDEDSLNITVTRKRHGGREYSIASNIPVDVFRQAIGVLASGSEFAMHGENHVAQIFPH